MTWTLQFAGSCITLTWEAAIVVTAALMGPRAVNAAKDALRGFRPGE